MNQSEQQEHLENLLDDLHEAEQGKSFWPDSLQDAYAELPYNIPDEVCRDEADNVQSRWSIDGECVRRETYLGGGIVRVYDCQTRERFERTLLMSGGKELRRVYPMSSENPLFDFIEGTWEWMDFNLTSELTFRRDFPDLDETTQLDISPDGYVLVARLVDDKPVKYKHGADGTITVRNLADGSRYVRQPR